MRAHPPRRVVGRLKKPSWRGLGGSGAEDHPRAGHKWYAYLIQ